MAKQNTEPNPFVASDLRAFIQGDVFEFKIVGTLAFWHWWKGDGDKKDEGLGLYGLSNLSRISVSTVKRTTAKMLKRDPPWIAMIQKKGFKNKYRLAMPRMSFKEAFSLAAEWMDPEEIQDLQLDLWDPRHGSLGAEGRLSQSHGQDALNKGFKDLDLNAIQTDAVAPPVESQKPKKAAGGPPELARTEWCIPWAELKKGTPYPWTGIDYKRWKELLMAVPDVELRRAMIHVYLREAYSTWVIESNHPLRGLVARASDYMRDAKEWMRRQKFKVPAPTFDQEFTATDSEESLKDRETGEPPPADLRSTVPGTPEYEAIHGKDKA